MVRFRRRCPSNPATIHGFSQSSFAGIMNGRSSSSSAQQQRAAFFTVTGLFCFWLLSRTRSGNTVTNGTTKSSVQQHTNDDEPNKKKLLHDLMAKYESCSIGPIVQKDSGGGIVNKPFWFPSYPGSDHGGVVTNLVVGLTGQTTAARSYYASTKGSLKKCFSTTTYTVTCGNIHPIVDLGQGAAMPTALKFQKRILVGVRNPMTSIPEHFHTKAVMYHNVQGQASLESWRSFRDEWLEKTAVTGWASVIGTWKNMTRQAQQEPVAADTRADSDYYYYDDIGMYLSYEALLDPEDGPVLTRQLATLVQDAGYPVVSPDNLDDISCVWYQAVQDRLRTMVSAKSSNTGIPSSDYEYATDYIPGYTASQKTYMIQQLTLLHNQYSHDDVLRKLLSQYVQDIRSNIVDDIPAAKEGPH